MESLSKKTLGELGDTDLIQRYRGTFIHYNKALTYCADIRDRVLSLVPATNWSKYFDDMMPPPRPRAQARALPQNRTVFTLAHVWNERTVPMFYDCYTRWLNARLGRAGALNGAAGHINVIIDAMNSRFFIGPQQQLMFMALSHVWTFNIVDFVLGSTAMQEAWMALFTPNRNWDQFPVYTREQFNRLFDDFVTILLNNHSVGLATRHGAFICRGRIYNNETAFGFSRDEWEARPRTDRFIADLIVEDVEEDTPDVSVNVKFEKVRFDPNLIELVRPAAGWYETEKGPATISYKSTKQYHRGFCPNNVYIWKPLLKTPYGLEDYGRVLEAAFKKHFSPKEKVEIIPLAEAVRKLRKDKYHLTAKNIALIDGESKLGPTVAYKDQVIGNLLDDRTISLTLPQFRTEIEECYSNVIFRNGERNAD